MRLHQRHWQKSVIFFVCVLCLWVQSTFSPLHLKDRSVRVQMSVVVLTGVQPIRQADWQCSLVVTQRSPYTWTHNAEQGQNSYRGYDHFCVFVRVRLACSTLWDIARRHKAPLSMLWRKHSKLTQKPLCLQARGGGGGGERGLAGAALPVFGLDTHLN